MEGRDGFESLSPSRRASSVGFDVFLKIKCLFSTTPEANLKRVVKSHQTLVPRAPDTRGASSQFYLANEEHFVKFLHAAHGQHMKPFLLFASATLKK